MKKSLSLILTITAFYNLHAAEIPTPSTLDADRQKTGPLLTEEQQRLQEEGDHMLQSEFALFSVATHPAKNPFSAGPTRALSSQRKRFDINEPTAMSWDDEKEYIRHVQSKSTERLAWLKSLGEQSKNVLPAAATSSSPTLTRVPSVDSSLAPMDFLPQPSQSIDEKAIELFIAKLLPNYKELGIHATMQTLPELRKKRLMLFITAAMMLDKEQEEHAARGMSEAGCEEWLRMATISDRENAAIKDLLISLADITNIRAQTRACIDRACAAFDSFQVEYAVAPIERPDLDLVSLARAENNAYQVPRDCVSPAPDMGTIKYHELSSSEPAKSSLFVTPAEPLVPHTHVADMNAFLRSLSPKLATIDLDQLPASNSKKTLMDRLPQAIIFTQKFAQAEEIRVKNNTAQIDKKEWKEWKKALLQEKQACFQIAFLALISAQYDNAVARRADILDQIEAYKLSMMGFDRESDCIDTEESPELRELLEAQVTTDNELQTAMQNLCSIATAQTQTAKRKSARRKLFKKNRYPSQSAPTREISQPDREIQSAENDYFLSTFESIL